MSARALMVLGTSSHAGKSLTAAALCRIFRQDGLRVAPFKAQNMALNSFATRDGGEIGRAQAMQAQASGVEPHVDMNPILLKPCGDAESQVIVNGKVYGTVGAVAYEALKAELIPAVDAAYARLARQYDVIVLEGAGSPVEMNLKARDLVNLRMAEVADARCVLVADIDRGGVFAALVGVYGLLEPAERARFCGFTINKFRGDARRFDSGIELLESKLGDPCLGVVPYLPDHGIDDEDAVSDDRRARRPEGSAPENLRVCVIALPYMSNFTDFSPLESWPGVTLWYARRPEDARLADVMILPGSKTTIPDLQWMQRTGWAAAVLRHAERGGVVIGVCGGYQMLGREIHDPHRVESETETMQGLGLLDAVTTLASEKVTRQARARFALPKLFGCAPPGPTFEGYEIHMGETRLGPTATPLFSLTRFGETSPIFDGAVAADGRIIGGYLHGLFDAPEACAALVSHLRAGARKWEADAGEPTVRANRDARYDALALHFRRSLAIKCIYDAMGVRL